MTPLPIHDGEAADRLYDLCDDPESRQVPADQIEDLCALSELGQEMDRL